MCRWANGQNSGVNGTVKSALFPGGIKQKGSMRKCEDVKMGKIKIKLYNLRQNPKSKV